MPSSACNKKSNTPTQSGSFPIVVTVTDGNGCTGTITWSVSGGLPGGITLNTATGFLTGTFFFFNDTATTEIYTLSLHDARPIKPFHEQHPIRANFGDPRTRFWNTMLTDGRSEEHTSELQSRRELVCRLLLE